ncbi:hypothetical protein CAEBREN_07091 [Caenorhabditis brenneri]|uniref:Uncharacterized protein n=1 Tax=Caenorhabditis brenneri TaxID=135651 RepID=G0MEQ3_CAEBE|nr:hypothetical protein CAEBREN_07091 [Caenorhabditis brenneri]
MPNLPVELFPSDENACRQFLDETFLNSPTASSEQPAAISPTSEPIQELQVLLAPEPMEPSEIDKKLVNVLLTAWIKETKQYNLYTLMKTDGVHDKRIVNASIKRIKAEMEKEKNERKEFLRCLSNDQLERLVFHVRSTASKIEESKGIVLAADRTIKEVAGVRYNKTLYVGRPPKKQDTPPPQSQERPENLDKTSRKTNIALQENQKLLNETVAKMKHLSMENADLKSQLEESKKEVERRRIQENEWDDWQKKAEQLIAINDECLAGIKGDYVATALTESMNIAAIPSQPHHSHPSEPMSFAACVRKQPSIESPKAEFLSEIKESFCNEHPRVDFCPTPSTLPPVPQQPVVQAPPPLTPEQIQQQQQFLKMQKIISEITTPSGFIGENPGITIGLVVILISGFCFFAALGLSFLTGKKPKQPVAPNRGRRGNQMRKPSKSRHPQRKEKTSSSMNDMENGSKRKDETKEKYEKQKSTNSKSKKNSKESIHSTS